MPKKPFIIKNLSVKKMPGFSRGVGEFNDLSPNINIIAGPNASGKSSVARLIRNLIWKVRDVGVTAGCSVDIDNTGWQVNAEQGNIRIQREGVDDEFKGIPPAESSGRYMLALHELIMADEAGLAKLIVKESIGGFDLEDAANKLGYSSSIKPTTIREYQEFVKAGRKYRETEQKHRELKQAEESLQDLLKERSRARDAVTKREFYTCVRDYLDAKLKFETISALHREFSPALETMTGEEDEAIENLGQEIREAAGGRDSADSEISRNRGIMSGLNLPPEGVDQAVPAEMESRVVAMERLGSEIREADRKIAELQSAAGEALKAIGGDDLAANWEGITLGDVSGLDRYLQKLHQASSERQFFETRRSALGELINGKEYADPEELRQGIRTLANWLQERKDVRGIPVSLVFTLTIAAVISGILAWIFGVYGLFFLPVPVIMGIFAYRRKPPGENIRESDYKKTGLKEIREWTVVEVSETLGNLMDELQEALQGEKIRREIESLNGPLREAEETLAHLRKQGDQWREKLKAIPEIPEEELKNYSGLYWYLKHVLNWHGDNSEALALRAGRDELYGQFTGNLERFNELSSAYGAGVADDAVTARAVYEGFREKTGTWKDCQNEIRRQTGIFETSQKQIEKSEGKLRDIYNRLGVEPGNMAMVRELTGQLERFAKVKQELYAARQNLAEKEKLLQGYSQYDKEIDPALVLTPDQVKEKIDTFAVEAGKLEEINRKITETETRINSVKQGHDLEENLADIDNARNRLEMVYEKNLSSVTGKLLTDHLRNEVKYQNRPALFKRANELFVKITGGRYKLIIDDKGEASFKGFDTALELGLDLDELSTGTRIQLLLAVRLAFIETQESLLAIPLLADELLANSDDIRAGAIIEALAEISKEGRQVFYFTAQGDEVDKWRYLLEGRQDVSLRVAEISEPGTTAGKPGSGRQVSGVPAFEFVHNIPLPENMDYNEYGELIGVPGFDILEDEVTGLHLWYLLDSSSLLYNCLSAGIRFWGQMETYTGHGGKIDGLDEKLFRKLDHRMKLLRRFRELYSTGRPRPIDRGVLEASGAVSPAFLDAVTKQMSALGNNPGELIHALRTGKVPRFQQAKTDELEQYLLGHDYIDGSAPLGKDEILVLLGAYLSNLEIDRAEAEKFINRVFRV